MRGIRKTTGRAQAAGGTTLGILPGPSRNDANPYLSFSIVSNLGHARNLILINSSDVIVAFDGSYGTLSEIAFANIMGKPIIGLDNFQFNPQGVSGQVLFTKIVETVEEIIVQIKMFI